MGALRRLWARVIWRIRARTATYPRDVALANLMLMGLAIHEHMIGRMVPSPDVKHRLKQKVQNPLK